MITLPRGREICQTFGDWLSDLASWQWFATFTFRDPKNPRLPGWSQVGWKAAHNALQKWAAAIDFHLTCDLSRPAAATWVAVMEYQHWRGVPHWHLLVAGIGQQRRLDWVDWWYREFGIARVLPYLKELGARYYLGKYLTKEVADIQFSQTFTNLTKNSAQNSILLCQNSDMKLKSEYDARSAEWSSGKIR